MTQFYSQSQVAKILGITTRSVYKLIHSGTLPSTKVGSLFRVTDEQLAEFTKANRFDPSAPPSSGRVKKR